MSKLLFIIFCCFCFTAQGQEYETGKVIDSLPVANRDGETFALYLPSTYESNKLSSVLFIFSPSGKGKQGVKKFIKSAERYNYILICSNNSKNGSLDRNLHIAQRLFNHVFSTFRILNNRIYLAGFSGGSRLATAIACSSEKIKGVIACGAGFTPIPEFIPSEPKFSYAGVCGDRDMNYKEMVNVRSYLNKKKIHNTLFTFDGNHRWPPDDQLLMAFNWLEIEAAKKGYINKSIDQIEDIYSSDYASAKGLREGDQLLYAADHYKRVIETYEPYINIDTLRQELKTIKDNENYASELKELSKALREEDELTTFFLNRFIKDFKNPKKSSIKWWEKEVEKLKSKERELSSQHVKMHERVKFKVFVQAYSNSNTGQTNITEQQSVFCKSLITLLSPW